MHSKNIWAKKLFSKLKHLNWALIHTLHIINLSLDIHFPTTAPHYVCTTLHVCMVSGEILLWSKNTNTQKHFVQCLLLQVKVMNWQCNFSKSIIRKMLTFIILYIIRLLSCIHIKAGFYCCSGLQCSSIWVTLFMNAINDYF